MARLLPAALAPIYRAGDQPAAGVCAIPHTGARSGGRRRSLLMAATRRTSNKTSTLAGFSAFRATRRRACFLDTAVQGVPTDMHESTATAPEWTDEIAETCCPNCGATPIAMLVPKTVELPVTARPSLLVVDDELPVLKVVERL